jgi:hypothetical protein
MGLDAQDIQFIRSKRKVYLTLFILAVLARVAGFFINPVFFILNILLLIGFLVFFLPAAKRGGYSTGVLVFLVVLLVVPFVIPLPLLGFISLIVMGLIDHNLYNSIKQSSY